MAGILRLQGVRIGIAPWILGWPRIRMARGGGIHLGNRVLLFSAPFANPLLPEGKTSLHAQISGASIELGDAVGISSSTLVARKLIRIGARTIVGPGCLIVDNDFHTLDHRVRMSPLDKPAVAPVEIGADCFIGTRSIILKGVTIGDRSVIGAGSVVTKSVPADSVAAGNPAKVIKKLEEEKIKS